MPNTAARLQQWQRARASETPRRPLQFTQKENTPTNSAPREMRVRVHRAHASGLRCRIEETGITPSRMIPTEQRRSPAPATAPREPMLALDVSVRRRTFPHYRANGCAFDPAVLGEADLSSAARAVAVRLNPFPSNRWWCGQREIENRDHLSMALATANRHDLLRIIEIDAFDADQLAEHLRIEGTRQVLLQHAEKADALFRIAVRVDDRFLDEGFEPSFAERSTSGHLSVDGLRSGLMAEGCRPPVRRELPDQALRMGGDTQQHIFEVRIRRDVSQLAALHQ